MRPHTILQLKIERVGTGTFESSKKINSQLWYFLVDMTH